MQQNEKKGFNFDCFKKKFSTNQVQQQHRDKFVWLVVSLKRNQLKRLVIPHWVQDNSKLCTWPCFRLSRSIDNSSNLKTYFFACLWRMDSIVDCQFCTWILLWIKLWCFLKILIYFFMSGPKSHLLEKSMQTSRLDSAKNGSNSFRSDPCPNKDGCWFWLILQFLKKNQSFNQKIVNVWFSSFSFFFAQKRIKLNP